VPVPRDDGEREACLDAFLRRRTEDGFVVESRTATQAILAPRPRLVHLPAFIRRGRHDGRQVVSVDEHNVISVEPAQPRRW
jgi:hypothetical protein